MLPCPHNLAAWQCAYYVHFIYAGALCQNKGREKLSEKADKKYCGECPEECDGHEVDKRFKRMQE